MRLSLQGLANLARTIAEGDFKNLNETLDHLDLSRDMRATVLIVVAARIDSDSGKDAARRTQDHLRFSARARYYVTDERLITINS